MAHAAGVGTLFDSKIKHLQFGLNHTVVLHNRVETATDKLINQVQLYSSYDVRLIIEQNR